MAEDLFDETPEDSRVENDREDLEIRQQQEASARDRVEITRLSITPQKLENSKSHEFLSRDTILAQFKDALDVEISVCYHDISALLEFMGLTESAMIFDAEHTAWTNATVGINGFGRREMNSTNINRKNESVKPLPAAPKGLDFK